jgi:hypothetical protein
MKLKWRLRLSGGGILCPIRKSFKKQFLVVLLLILILLIGYGCVCFYYASTVYIKSTVAESMLAEIKIVFFEFRMTHRRWPRTMQEIYGDKISKDTIVEKYYKDPISDAPFCCVAENGLYYKIDGNLYRVLVMLPRPYRTKLWPFGEIKTIIATSRGEVYFVSPSEIIDLNHTKADAPVAGWGG